jgi:uncharacterized protein (TIGR02246 family)
MSSDPSTGAAVEALSERLAENFNSGDFSALAAMFGEDALLMPPGARTISGRDGIRTFWREARRIRSVAFEPKDIKPIGDGAARETGLMRIGMRANPQRPANQVLGKYMLLWLHMDGQWQVESFIWNRIARPAGAGQGAGNRAGMGQGGGQRAGGPRGGAGWNGDTQGGGTQRGNFGGGRRGPGGGAGGGPGNGAGGGQGGGPGGGMRGRPGGGMGGGMGGGGSGGGRGGMNQGPRKRAPFVPRIG